MKIKATIIFVFFFPAICAASLLDDLIELNDKAVLYAGDFEKIDCPIGGKYDCLTWPDSLLKTKRGREFCLKPDSHVMCNFSCRGIVAVGDDKVPYLFIIDRIDGDFKKSSFKPYKCPMIF